MINILSWNIQNGKGVDGVVSLQRISNVIQSMGSPEIICLQEVSRGLELDADVGAPDQINELSVLFPGYELVFGIAVDASSSVSASRWKFGNVLLSKLPILSVQNHILPKPAVENVRYMTRQATEIVVGGNVKPMRIVNLHLEFHSLVQRIAQVEKLRDIQAHAIMEKELRPKTDPVGPYQAVPRPVDAIYCGDFNMLYGSEEYKLMRSPLGSEPQPFLDAWQLVNPQESHDPTCGIFDHKSWPEGPHCRDFFFVSGDCKQEVEAIQVDVNTDCSDHQPLIVTLSRA